jgi:phage tail sheath gpL-like
VDRPVPVTVVPVRDDGVDGAAVEVAVTPGTTAAVGADVLRDAVAVRLRVSTTAVHAAAVLTASASPQGGADLVSVVAVPAAPDPPGSLSLRSAAGGWP